MPINLQNEQNIATGWGPMPKLDAPNIGTLVGEILRNRLLRDKMTQESIADTIKNVREERQSGEYLDAMKAAGLVPQDYDAGGLGGAKMGTGLAKMIQDQREFEALEKHRRAMEARIGGRGRGGGGGGSEDMQVEAPEDYYGLSVAPGAPSRQTTRVINGIVHVHDTHGGWKPGPKWMQQGAGQSDATGQTDPKAIKEQGSLVEKMAMLESDRKKQEASDIAAGAKDPNYPQKVPFKQSDLYNWTANRLKQLQQMPGMPSTAPAGTPPPADSAAGHATDYGVKASDDTSGVRVKVISPDGKVGTLPASQLQDALVMGYKQVP